MQLLKVILWPKNSSLKPRTVDFELGHVNIISGEPKTGKSCIWPIVDYCMGSSSLRVPVGLVREATSWFGAVFAEDNDYLCVSRSSLDSKKYMLSFNNKINLETFPEPNTTEEEVKKHFNKNVSWIPKTPLGNVSFRDLTALNVIPQYEVSNPCVFLKKTYNHYSDSKIKHILPFILKTSNAGLSLVKSKMKKVEGKGRTLRIEVNHFRKRLLNLYKEAGELGLISCYVDGPFEFKTDELIDELIHLIESKYSKPYGNYLREQVTESRNSIVGISGFEGTEDCSELMPSLNNLCSDTDGLGKILLFGRILECLEYLGTYFRYNDLRKQYLNLLHEKRDIDNNDGKYIDINKREVSIIVNKYAELFGLDLVDHFPYLDIDEMVIKFLGPNGEMFSLIDVGGSYNHIGYNIAFYLAIHESLLIKRDKPVFPFLIIDQPIHSLTKNNTSNDNSNGLDVEFRERLLSALDNLAMRSEGKIQIILLEEHFNFNQSQYAKTVKVEDWRGLGNSSLVPSDWY